MIYAQLDENKPETSWNEGISIMSSMSLDDFSIEEAPLDDTSSESRFQCNKDRELAAPRLPTRFISPATPPKPTIDIKPRTECPTELSKIAKPSRVSGARSTSLASGEEKRKKDRFQHRISFAEFDSIQLISPRPNKTDLWYQREEFRLMQLKCKLLVEKQRNGNSNDSELNVRGLESCLNPGERYQKQRFLWKMVTEIQQLQRQCGVVDDEMIQRVCSQLSEDSTRIAAARGARDHESVEVTTRRRSWCI